MRYISPILTFVDKALNWELFSDSPNPWILDCAQEDRLGVKSDNLWSDAPTRETIRLTSQGEVRLASREQSPRSETDRTSEHAQEEGETLILPLDQTQ